MTTLEKIIITALTISVIAHSVQVVIAFYMAWQRRSRGRRIGIKYTRRNK